MRLEKLITTNPIWDFFTETFDLLSAGQFENLVFRPQSQGGQICVSWISRRRRRRRRRTNSQIQIQAPPNAPRDEILPQGKPSLLTEGIDESDQNNFVNVSLVTLTKEHTHFVCDLF